jgi:uridine kinase
VLFLVLAPLKYLAYLVFGELALGSSFVSIVLMKLPVLIFDVLFLRKLVAMVPIRRTQIEFFYWLNPILIYISFVYSHNDLIPMFFIVSSLLLVAKKRVVPSAVFAALAILCKFHVVILLPLIFAYIWRSYFLRQALEKIGYWLLTFLPIFLLGFLPIIFSDKFGYVSVGSPEAFRIFSIRVDLDSNLSLYLGLALVVMMLGRLLLASGLTSTGLFFGAGLVMGVLLVVTHAMPGWYFWVLPFTSLFFAIYSYSPRILWFVNALLYLVFFNKLSFLPPHLNNLVYSILFTMLQLSFVAVFIAIYIMVMRDEAPLGRSLRPTVLGIAGNSGAGKNLLSKSLAQLFGVNDTQFIEGDDYHKWERGDAKWQDYTHLHPRANYLDNLNDHLETLTKGRLVFQSHYDHATGRFTEPRALLPTKSLIVQGLHTFYLRSMRNLFDLRIFLAPDEVLRLAWKVQRDCGERGYDFDKVIKNFSDRSKDSKLHIEPQKEMADLILEYQSKINLESADLLRLKEIPLRLKITIWNDSPVLELVRVLESEKNLQIDFEASDLDINRVCVVFDGAISEKRVAEIAESVLVNIREITRSHTGPKWEAGYDGLIQLIVATLLKKGLYK